MTERLIEPEAKSVTYGSYLKVNELLDLQKPLSSPPEQDELLFIQIHQVYELWFKQILHEVAFAEKSLDEDKVMAFIRTMRRIATIQSVLTHQVDILETMTPVDFNRFREFLNPASGFQSYQFRELEFRLGAKEAAYLKFHKHDPLASGRLDAAIASPTLYDRFLRHVARRGFAVPEAVIQRDVTQPHVSSPEVRDVLLSIYRHADKHYDLYLALEALIDLDEGILLWRQRHVAMVERMIGSRKGTGGSSGVKYLSKTLEKRFFPEIWETRDWLGASGHAYS
jgi:tryptophan 2,3-dioxygenase